MERRERQVGQRLTRRQKERGKHAEREKCDLLHKGDTEAVSERLRYRVRAGGRQAETGRPTSQRSRERQRERQRQGEQDTPERQRERDRKTEIPYEGTGQKCCPSL